MSARARIHAMFPILVDDSDTEASARTAELDTRLNELVAEVLTAAADAAATIHQNRLNCPPHGCTRCEVRTDILDVLRSVADAVGSGADGARHDALVAARRVLPPVDAVEFMQLCVDLDTARARIAVLEKATAGAAPATPTTDLHQTFLAAVQSFRSSVHQPGGWAQQFTTHLMTAINPPGDDHTPDFFQPGHTYQQGPWAFRCGTVTAHPQTGEPHALGWLTVSDGSWTTYAYSADAWGDDWTDITTQGDNK